ncbi:SAP domain-containing ribonucleoprotein-like isoform X1 [Ptychodera flava]|uniref:SAP domain-containing ribonucleoprotein-like isoform X1 n=1 Tax=Ptychodera flava TaxID=63121 RepID=UPI003969D401
MGIRGPGNLDMRPHQRSKVLYPGTLRSNMAELVDVKKLKVAELRKLLQEKGLDSKGNKAELVERLQEHISANGDVTLSQLAGTTEDEEDVLGPDEEEEEEEEGEEEKIEKTNETGETSPEKPTVIKISTEIKPVTSPVAKVKPSIISTEGLTEAEKIAKRAQRFGAPVSADAKKAARAERFGIANQQSKTSSIKSGSTSVSVGDLDKIRKRAERFGESVSSTAVKLEEVERKKRRLERFGSATTTTATTVTKLKGNLSEAELKKQKRAERFGL